MQTSTSRHHNTQAGPPEHTPPGANWLKNLGTAVLPAVFAAVVAVVVSVGVWALAAMYDRDPHMALFVLSFLSMLLMIGLLVAVGAVLDSLDRIQQLVRSLQRRIELYLDHKEGD